VPFFQLIRNAFEKLVRHYGIRFCSAADIGCGTGLFACYLSMCWGVPVYAVDKSAAMLFQARRNCRNADVCFLQQDVRCLELPSPVDLITANFDTLNHLNKPRDVQRAFVRVAKSLLPGGHFYFDILTPCQPSAGYEVFVRNHCTVRSWLRQGMRWEPKTRLMRITAVQHRTGSCLPVVERVTERAYSASEIGKWLSQAGFVIRGVHDFERLCTPTGCPARIIIVANKRYP
jgi:SAM-dependent methyltransferase